jgi:hypothetical protein
MRPSATEPSWTATEAVSLVASRVVGGIDGHPYTGGVASPAFRKYPDGVVDAGGVLAEGCHLLEEFPLCKSVGKRVDIFKPRDDGAEIGKLDDVACLEFLAEQDGVFEALLGTRSGS